MEKQIFKFPKWIIAVYAFSAVVLVPWTFNLAENLPTRQLAHHWDIAWTGVDVLMFVLFALTVILAIRRTIWMSLTAVSLSTVLLIDGWFDVLTSKPGHQQVAALLLAVLIEIPMATLTYFLAYRAILHLHNRISSLTAK